MTSRLASIQSTLSNNWGEVAPITTAIDWFIGEPEEPGSRFNRSAYRIEVKNSLSFNSKKSLSRSHLKDMIFVDVWIQHTPDRADEITATETMETIVDRVYSVVQSQQKAFTGYTLMTVQGDQKIGSDAGIKRVLITLTGRREI